MRDATARETGLRGLLSWSKAVRSKARCPKLRIHDFEMPTVVGSEFESKFSVIAQPGLGLECPALEGEEMLVMEKPWR